MKQTFITMFILLIGSMTIQAQTNKAEKVKNIRAAYAKAKEMSPRRTCFITPGERGG